MAAGEWGGELVRAWDHWIDLPLRIGDVLAAGVLGAAPGSVTIADSTTVNLFRVASAALDDRPDRRVIVADRAEFPTDRYVLQGLAAARGLEIRWLDGDPFEGLAAEEVIEALDGRRRAGAAVSWSAIARRRSWTSRRSTAAARVGRRATPVGPVARRRRDPGRTSPRRDVGLAVGCTYKYLFGGPGAPAYLYVAPRLQDRLRPPIQGWFAQPDQFAIGQGVRARPGHARLARRHAADPRADRDRGGRPGRGRGRDRRHPREGRALTAYAVERLDADLAPLGCTLGSPRDPRGAARTSGSATRMLARSPTASGSAA